MVHTEKMKIGHLLILTFSLITVISCQQNIGKETTSYTYFDNSISDTISTETLTVITDEQYLEYGVRIAFINKRNDTIIPFGKYAYYGTDTLKFYCNVFEYRNDSSLGRQIAIDRNQNILFDLVLFDNGPEPFKEGVTRVLRNGKMGYANKFGRLVIPCEYDFTTQFEKGKAKVTYNANEYLDLDGNKRFESDEWFIIDKKGKKKE